MPTIPTRKFGDLGFITLHKMKLLSKPILFEFEVEGIFTEQRLTIHIDAHTQVEDIALIQSLSEDKIYDLILNPVDWKIGDRSGTKFYFKEIKES